MIHFTEFENIQYFGNFGNIFNRFLIQCACNYLKPIEIFVKYKFFGTIKATKEKIVGPKNERKIPPKNTKA